MTSDSEDDTRGGGGDVRTGGDTRANDGAVMHRRVHDDLDGSLGGIAAAQATHRDNMCMDPPPEETVHAADQAGGGRPEKPRANAFGNMIRSVNCPKYLVTEWDGLKNLKQKDRNRRMFVEKVVEAVGRGKLFTDPYFTALQTKSVQVLTKSESDKQRQGWRSYKFVCDKEGKEVTDEFMRLKLIEYRRYAKLPADTRLVRLCVSALLSFYFFQILLFGF